MVMRSWRWERRMNFDRMRSLRAAFDLTSHVWVETHAAPIYRFPYLEHTHTHAHTHTTHTHTSIFLSPLTILLPTSGAP